MLKNYFLVAVRNLYRNKYYSMINIFGLGVAMAMCVVGYVNYQFSQSFNTMHGDTENVHVVSSYSIVDGQRREILSIPTPLAPAMTDHIPGVEAYSRFAVTTGDVRFGDQVFEENLCFVDANFFDIFSFGEVEGSIHSFSEDAFTALITESVAQKLFGEESPVGSTITIATDRKKQFDFVVTGVVAEPPSNSSFFGGVWLNYHRQVDIFAYELESWNDWTSAAFVRLESTTLPAQVEAGLGQFLSQTNEANPNLQRDGFSLAPMRELGALVHEVGGPFNYGMHPAAIIAPSVTALLVLLLACFNFMNTSIAFASRRVREIGVRKVVGGRRGQLVVQFLSENLLLCGLALIMAVVLAEIFVPAYGSLWPQLDLSINYLENGGLVAFMVGLLIITGVAAGSYPAFYVSKFSPIAIMRGRQKIGRTSGLIRVLLTLQLALSMTAIVVAVILTQNAAYIKAFDYGYEDDDVFTVVISDESEYDMLRTALDGNPKVASIGVSRHLMMRSWSEAQAEIDGTESRVLNFRIGEGFVETMNLDLLEGRTFDAELSTDVEEAIMINRTLAATYGWESPLDKLITLVFADEKKTYRVVGVVDDFFPNGMNSAVRPTVMRMAPPDQYRYVVVRFHPGNDEEQAGFIEDVWKRNYPNYAFDAFWHKDRMMQEYATNDAIRLVFLYIGIIVVIISSMGLLALVSLNIARRTREIGIRKALGASAGNIGKLIVREFVILTCIGSVLAAGMGYFLTDSLLSSIWRYYTDFGVFPFVLSTVIVVGVGIAAVGYRVYAAARSNPVEALKCE